MDIKLKYNIGDYFWVMRDNAPRSFRVEDIHIHVSLISSMDSLSTHKVVTDIRYESNSTGKRVQVLEMGFYPTKAALLATL